MRFSERVWNRGICQVVKAQCLRKATELRAPKIYLALLCSVGVLSFSRRDKRDPPETPTTTSLILTQSHWTSSLISLWLSEISAALQPFAIYERPLPRKMRSGKRIKKGRKGRPSIAIHEFTYSLTNGYGMLAIFQRLCWSMRYKWIRNSLGFEE